MSILVVGSIALDTVETPFGKVEDSPGGSALYFSAAASFFAPVNVVGVVGKDFDFEQIDFLRQRNVDLGGLMVEDGLTFRWGGRYKKDMNRRVTLFTYLNVFEQFTPRIPPHYQDSTYIFLANIDPELQLKVLESVKNPRLTVLDTMNFWISGKREALEKVIQQVDVLIVNDEEIRELTGSVRLYSAASELLTRGPKALVIKKGEHGAILVTNEGYFFTPAYPVEHVLDPTGAGDTFAGGFLGYLAAQKEISHHHFKQAVIYGSTVASFVVEDFSFSRLKQITAEDVHQRASELKQMMTL